MVTQRECNSRTSSYVWSTWYQSIASGSTCNWQTQSLASCRRYTSRPAEGISRLTKRHRDVRAVFPMDKTFAWTYCTQLATRESTQIQGVAQIMELIPPERWGHVLSADNPARWLCEMLAHTLWLRFSQVQCLVKFNGWPCEIVGELRSFVVVEKQRHSISVDIEILHK